MSDLDARARSVVAGDRRALAKAITLVESARRDHQEQAQRLLELLLPHTGAAARVGISGVPGVGKSTFIEALGLYLLSAGHRVAVLAVDPSSGISGGSILGDKTRMPRLASADGAFIRPSPAGGSLGGVARRTREVMLVCEAAGHDGSAPWDSGGKDTASLDAMRGRCRRAAPRRRARQGAVAVRGRVERCRRAP